MFFVLCLLLPPVEESFSSVSGLFLSDPRDAELSHISFFKIILDKSGCLRRRGYEMPEHKIAVTA
ncbi:MAG: hypothetical protein C4520_13000 [Candidatus Abyssobacteria bacterium SURF_5]|uniref:Uncharacterized protein n=1 Tax=Abyssobacteria bacterium (strain SURF_5) TaxID=2093360 RepID=A0A3A4NJQ5_ABYX5|nr:MAG: hypothetical protein C4520_13000 [Candidatus Abyssubacteria bacterium SURF_5]